MATKLKGLQITSTDLVKQGANPEAHIRLFKRKDTPEAGAQGTQGGAETLFRKCIGAIREVFGKSAEGSAEPVPDIEKGTAFYDASSNNADSYDSLYDCSNDGNSIEPDAGESCVWNEKGEMDNMKIDKSKMTREERAIYAGFEKKYGISESPDFEAADTPAFAAPTAATPTATPGTGANDETGIAKGTDTPPELHPEVKKAIDENRALSARVEELQKKLEIRDLTAITQKYEIIGKDAGELAEKLYNMKKAGGGAYDDFVGLLDEQVTLVEKSGLFAELGSNASGSPDAGSELSIKAAEIVKSDRNISASEAIAKAFEDNPALAAKYEKDYMTGRAK